MRVQFKSNLMAFALLFAASGVFALASPMYAQAAVAPNPDVVVKKVSYCHAKPADTAKNGWKLLNTSVSVVYKKGHASEHAADIIPPFTYKEPGKKGDVVKFQGLNWDAEGQAIFANDCVVPDEEPEVNYCDPSQKPGGVSIAEWVPKDVNCVEFTVVEQCGELGVNLINDTTLNYAVSWSEGEADWNFDTALPATFSEDYNGGSVDVYYWLVGEEADYVTNRGIYNYWEQENPGAGMVTVDTDCETTTVPEDDDEEETNGTVVLGTSTDTPARAGELPTSLPVTGANEQLAAIVTIVSTIATAAGVYTLRGRSADLTL